MCLCACNGRAVSEPYYSQRARSVCVSLSAFFIVYCSKIIRHKHDIKIIRVGCFQQYLTNCAACSGADTIWPRPLQVVT